MTADNSTCYLIIQAQQVRALQRRKEQGRGFTRAQAPRNIDYITIKGDDARRLLVIGSLNSNRSSIAESSKKYG
jgi:sugar lactone lactonase YvrE